MLKLKFVHLEEGHRYNILFAEDKRRSPDSERKEQCLAVAELQNTKHIISWLDARLLCRDRSAEASGKSH